MTNCSVHAFEKLDLFYFLSIAGNNSASCDLFKFFKNQFLANFSIFYQLKS